MCTPRGVNKACKVATSKRIGDNLGIASTGLSGREKYQTLD
jgi:hypothetical protein